MRYIVSIAAFLLLFQLAQSQNCNCKTEYLWVKSFMEKNHPGYNSDIKSPDEPAYKKFTAELLKKIESDKSEKYCIVYLKQYIRYLKDHHSNINQNSRPVVETNQDSLQAFIASPLYQETEKIKTDSLELVTKLSKSQPDDIEGIYITSDTTYTVAVYKDRTTIRDYVGVIIGSRTKTWEKGQVKLEIKLNPDNSRVGYIYLRNHTINFQEWQPEKGVSPIPGWVKLYQPKSASLSNNIDNDLIRFKELDNSTALISVRTFSGSASRELDSAYAKIIPELKKYPNLIIDVRNNGGGSDRNYNALMPLLYTDTIYNDFVELFYTADNQKAYEEMRDEAKANPERWGKTGYQSWEYRLNQMKGKPLNSFFAISPKGSKAYYKISNENPKKIAILYNRNCASSCEQLLIDAAFSKKVKLVGENSGGYIAYGNVMSITTPCGNTLNWTTTRKNSDRKYEFVGVEPQVRIPATETDWVQYTRQLLAK